nr:MAG TPA: hypothetical protein [Caudoviricetes sp.]
MRYCYTFVGAFENARCKHILNQFIVTEVLGQTYQKCPFL